MVRNRAKKMLLVGVWANRNWILGNWLKEVKLRKSDSFKIFWTPFIFAGKRAVEKYIPRYLPKYGSYFFSYPTIFEHYLDSHRELVESRSIVLYPHNEPELGSLGHQAEVLNRASLVYFFCSSDARMLISQGLDSSKCIIAYCAVDVDCVPNEALEREENLVILASNFGPRKGLEILPKIVVNRPDLNFIGLGRGWEDLIQNTSLKTAPNFRYLRLNKRSRNKYFSKAKIFLSLSNLEGGPVPLIEAMAMGVIPVVTKTGFAPDLITNSTHGILIPVKPDLGEVSAALDKAILLKNFEPRVDLTWDRITSMMISDHLKILNLNN